MDAKQFFCEFVNRTKENNIVDAEMIPSYPDLVGCSFEQIYRGDAAAYTELINKYIIDNIITEAYTRDDPRRLVAQHEYFRIDTIGYQRRYTEMSETEANKLGLNRHFWDLKIVVEHENSKKDWMDEVIKLTHVRCPLKVVIAYNYCDKRDDNKEGDLQKLNFVAGWMTRVSVYEKNANEEFLVIMGNGAPRTEKNQSYECFDYRGYIFNSATSTFERVVL